MEQLRIAFKPLCKHCKRRRPMHTPYSQYGEYHALCEPCALANVRYVNQALGTHRLQVKNK